MYKSLIILLLLIIYSRFLILINSLPNCTYDYVIEQRTGTPRSSLIQIKWRFGEQPALERNRFRVKDNYIHDGNMVIATINPSELIKSLNSFQQAVISDSSSMINFMTGLNDQLKLVNNIQNRIIGILGNSINSTFAYTDMLDRLSRFQTRILAPMLASFSFSRFRSITNIMDPPLLTVNIKVLSITIDFPVLRPVMFSAKCESTHNGAPRSSVVRAVINYDCGVSFNPAISTINVLDNMVISGSCIRTVSLYSFLMDDAYDLNDFNTWPSRYNFPPLDKDGIITYQLGARYMKFSEAMKFEVASWSDAMNFDYFHEIFLPTTRGLSCSSKTRWTFDPKFDSCKFDVRTPGSFTFTGFYPGGMNDLFKDYLPSGMKARVHQANGAYIGEILLEKWRILDPCVIKCCSWSNSPQVTPESYMIEEDFAFRSGAFISSYDEVINYALRVDLPTSGLEEDIQHSYNVDDRGSFVLSTFYSTAAIDLVDYTCRDMFIRSYNNDLGLLPIQSCVVSMFVCKSLRSKSFYTQNYKSATTRDSQGPIKIYSDVRDCTDGSEYCKMIRSYTEVKLGVFSYKPELLQYKVTTSECSQTSFQYCNKTMCSTSEFSGATQLNSISQKGLICDSRNLIDDIYIIRVVEASINVTRPNDSEYLKNFRLELDIARSENAEQRFANEKLSKDLSDYKLKTDESFFNLSISYYFVTENVNRMINEALVTSLPNILKESGDLLSEGITVAIKTGGKGAELLVSAIAGGLGSIFQIPSFMKGVLADIVMFMFFALVIYIVVKSILSYHGSSVNPYNMWSNLKHKMHRNQSVVLELPGLRIKKFLKFELNMISEPVLSGIMSQDEVDSKTYLKALVDARFLIKGKPGFVLLSTCMEKEPDLEKVYEIGKEGNEEVVFVLRHGGFSIIES